MKKHLKKILIGLGIAVVAIGAFLYNLNRPYYGYVILQCNSGSFSNWVAFDKNELLWGFDRQNQKFKFTSLASSDSFTKEEARYFMSWFDDNKTTVREIVVDRISGTVTWEIWNNGPKKATESCKKIRTLPKPEKPKF